MLLRRYHPVELFDFVCFCGLGQAGKHHAAWDGEESQKDKIRKFVGCLV